MNRRFKRQVFTGKVRVGVPHAKPVDHVEVPRDTVQPYHAERRNYFVRDSKGDASPRMKRDFAFDHARRQQGMSYVICCTSNRLVGTVPHDPSF